MKTYGDVLDYAMQQKQHGHDVFVEYSPHVNELTVRVFKDGWKNDKNGVNANKMKCYLDSTSAEDFIDFIKNALEDDDAEDHF